MPTALVDQQPAITPNELAWLATQDDVESRLIFTERRDGSQSYRASNGPFTEQLLSELPPTDWTLLVHDVEKHLPDFRTWLSAVSFVPDWRIDDLMVSCAAPGGSVGPHKDNYDVFLCQGAGSREWRLSGAGTVTAATVSGELSLLQAFDGEQTHTTLAGDVLYVPPGTPHWGVANCLCVTYSIGMRAPLLADIVLATGNAEADFANTDVARLRSREDVFYTDEDLQLAEATPGLISTQTIQRCRQQFDTARVLDDRQLAIALGIAVTTPKEWLSPEKISATDLQQILEKDTSIWDHRVHGMTRIAFCEIENESFAFANGTWRSMTISEHNVFRKLCETRKLSEAFPARLREGRCDEKLLKWLICCGVIDLNEE